MPACGDSLREPGRAAAPGEYDLLVFGLACKE